jgi:hypothetical protein
VIPYPETLGYEADAERALGDTAGAMQTEDLIRTVERIGNTQRISDRLLAIYYSEHRRYPHDAYAIAKRELATRDDILTEDTLAWAAAMDGRCAKRSVSIRKIRSCNIMRALSRYTSAIAMKHVAASSERSRSTHIFMRCMQLTHERN